MPGYKQKDAKFRGIEGTFGGDPARRALRPKLPEGGPDLPPACPAGPAGAIAAPGAGNTASGRPASM